MPTAPTATTGSKKRTTGHIQDESLRWANKPFEHACELGNESGSGSVASRKRSAASKGTRRKKVAECV